MKALSLPISVIVIIVILLLVLVFVAIFFTGTFNSGSNTMADYQNWSMACGEIRTNNCQTFGLSQNTIDICDKLFNNNLNKCIDTCCGKSTI